MKKIFVISALIAAMFSQCYAQSITVEMYKTVKKGRGASVGRVVFKDIELKNGNHTVNGVLITPHLHGLPPGEHGFHVHEIANCANDGLAAGGHFDPGHTGKHLGPYQEGHLGDLPVLYVNKHGDSTTPVYAPRLQVKDILGHSLMIHAGGDNYSDSPEPLGGGGARIACGIIADKSKSKD
ncbi:MAG: superoxide dismutase family protein [Pseudomonadota bacterium]